MFTLHNGDNLTILPRIPDRSVDAIITDPPYPEIKRKYGEFSESEWHALMDRVVAHAKRILKPTGSAVFILQPNSEKVGTMRLWLWEFLLRTAKDWNFVQEVYWLNTAPMPRTESQKKFGLLKRSVKYCLWFGPPDCYRDQDAVLWEASEVTKNWLNMEKRALRITRQSGSDMNESRCQDLIRDRGGVAPFNVIPCARSRTKGHPAATPLKLCDWWVRYLTKPGDLVLDPFNGSGTVGLAALNAGRNYVGIERDAGYCELTERRLENRAGS